jgi:hypothetical protein
LPGLSLSAHMPATGSRLRDRLIYCPINSGSLSSLSCSYDALQAGAVRVPPDLRPREGPPADQAGQASVAQPRAVFVHACTSPIRAARIRSPLSLAACQRRAFTCHQPLLQWRLPSPEYHLP